MSINNVLETGLKSFNSHELKSKPNHVILNNLYKVCVSHHSGLFRTYTFSCLCRQFLQSLQSCRHVLCWQRIISILMYAQISAGICSLIAGRQMILQVHHYEYKCHTILSRLIWEFKEEPLFPSAAEKGREKNPGEFKQLVWRNILVLCNS